MSKHQRKTLAFLLRLTVIAVFGGSFVVSLHTPGKAEEAFPWCVQGETLQCYYATREQCELTVNYHGCNPRGAQLKNFSRRRQLLYLSRRVCDSKQLKRSG